MFKRPFRIIFMGTPDFAVPSLETLIKGPDDVVAVVTQPDRPKGRGRKLVPPPVKLLAEDHGIPVLQPTAIKTEAYAKTLATYEPDIMVVAAYGRILPPSILNLAPHGCINIHGSLLPRHRGAAPIQWSIIKGDREVGVTIMQMDKGLDTGDILMKKSISLASGETAGTLFSKIAHLGSQALMDTLDMLAGGGLALIPQDHSKATHAPMLTKEDGRINWNRPAAELDCLIRGLDPWPTGFSFLNGKKIQFFNPEVVHRESDAPPGTLIRADRTGLLVSTKRFCLLIREVKLEGKKRMSAEAFLNGCRIESGTIFSSGTP